MPFGHLGADAAVRAAVIEIPNQIVVIRQIVWSLDTIDSSNHLYTVPL